MMIAAPITHAQIAPGPAICAARHAPNNQPEPMIEPRPVSIRANGPTSRRIWLAWDIDVPAKRHDGAEEGDICRVCGPLSPGRGHAGHSRARQSPSAKPPCD